MLHDRPSLAIPFAPRILWAPLILCVATGGFAPSAAAALGASTTLALHGGSYPPPPPPTDPPPPGGAGGNNPGPGDTPNSGGAPHSPGPSGPSSPGPSAPGPGGPSGPAPDGPRSPGGGPGSAPGPSPSAPRASSPGADLGGGPDLYDWSHWWHLERDAYLDLRSRVQAAPSTPEGQSRTAVAGRAPSELVVETVVVPRLLTLVEGERDDDFVTGALVALARIDAPSTGRAPELATRIRAAISARLAAPNQEIEETAALALGLLGGDEEITLLVALLADDNTGRRLTGGAVPTRTRAFAAFGLGLAGHASRGDDRAIALRRQRAALALVEVLESGTHAGLDVPVAALIALGLCPLSASPTLPPEELREREAAQHVLSAGSQLAYLERWLSPPRGTAAMRPERARAHAFVAAARIARSASGGQRNATLARLAEIALDAAESQELRAAAAVALGELADSSMESADRDARAALMRQARRGKSLERRFALIALASAAGRGAHGEQPFAGADEARRFILGDLARGRSGDRTWLALALGVLDEAQVAAGDTSSSTAGERALADLLQGERNAVEIGAFAVSLALSVRSTGRAPAAGELLQRVLDRVDDPEARGHALVATGLLGHGIDESALRDSLGGLRYQPALLWSTAVTLGLVGDRHAVDALVQLLAVASSSASRAAVAAALGAVGDQRAVAPLLAHLDDTTLPTGTRAFAAVALGLLCDRDPLPWRYPIAHALPYFASTATLIGDGNGILEIL
jgi:HEAT repeat protein